MKATKIVENIIIIVTASVLLMGGIYFVNDSQVLFNNQNYLNAIVTEAPDHLNDSSNNYIVATVTSYRLRGETVSIPYDPISYFLLFVERPINVGDNIRIVATENGGFRFVDYNRLNVVLVPAIILFALIIFFGKLKGLNTLISFIFTYTSIFAILVPGVLMGKNVYVIAFLVFMYIIIFSLLLILGFNKKTLGASVGCFVGLIFSSIMMLIVGMFIPFVTFMPFENFSENSLRVIESSRTWLFVPDVQGIIFTSVLLGALGAVKDVSTSISSSLWELNQSGVQDSKSLFKSGLNIGLDTLSTQVNNLVLAYVGSALPLFLLINYIAQPTLAAFNRVEVVMEITRALVGVFSLIIVIPATSVCCSYLFCKKTPQLEGGR